ncbi:MAG: hypothetical protein K1X75_14475 [Leptospirales bacterium]|nr:hypothetical protein [Leptospirales bacterium]
MKGALLGLRRSLVIALPSIAALLLGRHFTASFLPPVWPDEALFSSPAASLAAGGPFATRVLSGLIPGMDQATLWNSPLYMLLLSAVYQFSGESLEAARWLSTALAAMTLLAFQMLARDLLRSSLLAALSGVAVALDPLFLRSANAARMDMLALGLSLTAMWALLRSSRLALLEQEQPRSLRYALLGGMAIGGAACSHPIAIVLAPLAVVALWPHWRGLRAAVIGALLTSCAWIYYILSNWSLFQVQFLSQLRRKSDIVQWSGGDTGGVFVVYLAQYSLRRPGMMLVALLIGASLALGLWQGWRLLHKEGAGRPLTWRNLLRFPAQQFWRRPPELLRFSIMSAALFAMTLAASEMWYPLQFNAYLILLAAMIAETGSWRVAPAALAFLLFPALSAYYVHHASQRHLASAYRQRLQDESAAAAECRRVYLRVRPDPYFELGRNHPRVERLEFVPGKLRFGVDPESGKSPAAFLIQRYEQIDCFLLDANHSWEPLLHLYLWSQAGQWEVRRLPAIEHLEAAWLWRRRF